MRNDKTWCGRFTFGGQKGTTEDIETKRTDLAWSKQKVLLVFLE